MTRPTRIVSCSSSLSKCVRQAILPSIEVSSLTLGPTCYKSKKNTLTSGPLKEVYFSPSNVSWWTNNPQSQIWYDFYPQISKTGYITPLSYFSVHMLEFRRFWLLTRNWLIIYTNEMATTPSEAADVVGDVPNGPRPSLWGEEIMRVPLKLKGLSGYLIGSSPAS